MDAQSRMNFINAVASGEKKPCPHCGSMNDSAIRFCAVCGADMSGAAAPPQAAVTPQAVPAAAPQAAAPTPESQSAFALGLPAWDLLPPQVAIWRKKK